MKNLYEITIADFKDAIDKSLGKGHTNIAPLGMSGDTIIIHEQKNDKSRRCQQVSIRLYCGNPELLITSNDGDFLFYGRYSVQIGADVLAERYFTIFSQVRYMIPLETGKSAPELVVEKDASHSRGFEIMAAAEKAGVI